MKGELRVVDDVSVAFAELFTAELRAAPAATEGEARWRAAFSGGPTAQRCYERLATVPGLPWDRVEAYWGDERCVPPDDPDSNSRMGREVLLDAVDPPPAAVHPMSCDAGAPAYDELVRAVGRFDLVHLGLGPDGHTASLFPGSTALEDPGDSLVLLNSDPSGRNPHARMTLTLAVLDAARLAVFTVAGAEKREALARVRAGEDLPGGRVASERVVWLVDRAAAAAD